MGDVLTQNWEKKMYRVGDFGRFKVVGFQYECASGQKGWHITAWTQQGPLHDHWVSGEDFFPIRIYIPTLSAGRMVFELGGVAMDVSPEVRETVLKAIAQWEVSKLGELGEP